MKIIYSCIIILFIVLNNAFSQNNLIRVVTENVFKQNAAYLDYRKFAKEGIVYFWDSGIISSSFDTIRVNEHYLLKKISVREYDLLNRKKRRSPIPIVKLYMFEVQDCMFTMNVFVGYVYEISNIKSFAVVSECQVSLTMDLVKGVKIIKMICN